MGYATRTGQMNSIADVAEFAVQSSEFRVDLETTFQNTKHFEDRRNREGFRYIPSSNEHEHNLISHRPGCLTRSTSAKSKLRKNRIPALNFLKHQKFQESVQSRRF